MKVIKWHSFVKKRLVNLKGKKLVVRDVNIIKKYFGIIIGNGDVHAEFDIRKYRFTEFMKGETAMDSRFFERKCFATTSDCLLEFMKEQKDDSSLIFNMEEDTKEVFLYSPAFDVEYNEDDIMDCVGRELGVEINNLFVDGDKYCAAIYFTVRKLEQ